MLGKKNKKAGTQGALQEAKNWYADRYQFVVVQRNVLAIITVLALAGLGVTTFAVARIADSKTFEPYIIQVEEKTGITTMVDENSVQKYTADEIVIRYFLNLYVTSREGYNVVSYQYDYNQLVRLLSSSLVYGQFYKTIRPEAADSPVKLGRAIRRDIAVKSISFIESKKVQIRIKKEQIGPQPTDNWVKHYIVTAEFDFFPLELSLRERYINPLGFQITGYRIDEDTAI